MDFHFAGSVVNKKILVFPIKTFTKFFSRQSTNCDLLVNEPFYGHWVAFIRYSSHSERGDRRKTGLVVIKFSLTARK